MTDEDKTIDPSIPNIVRMIISDIQANAARLVHVSHGGDGTPIAEAIIALCKLHNEMWERYDAMYSTTCIELDEIANGRLPSEIEQSTKSDADKQA
jgi:hypothetical protein